MSITDLFSHDDRPPLAGLSGEQISPAPAGLGSSAGESDREP